MTVGKEILEQLKGKYCSIDEIETFVKQRNPLISRKTVVWQVNELVKKGKVVRVGRGVYLFAPKKRFNLTASGLTRRAYKLLNSRLNYLEVTITDTSSLGDLMNLQPFSFVVCIETRKTAVNAVLSALQKEKIEAYSKKDFPKVERYVTTSQPVFVRPELAVNPSMPKEKNMRMANIEKILVDLVCDEDIYGQYQGSELENIYMNATERYAVNYSQMLKYAAARGKKTKVVEYLSETTEFKKVRDML